MFPLLLLLFLLQEAALQSVTCKYSSYKYGPCSLPCGAGSHQATRTVMSCTGSANCQKACTATSLSRQCNVDPCPIRCTYSKWGKWTQCTAPCDGGSQTRARKLTVGLAKNCPLPLSRTRICNISPCPTTSSCAYNNWSRWGSCSKECDGGTHSRTRTVRTGSKTSCVDVRQSRDCNVDPCPCANPLDPRCCAFSAWTKWSGCSASCNGGTKTRNRTLVQGDTTVCKPLLMTSLCNLEDCPTTPTCKYHPWSRWSSCSAPCGGGTQTKSRVRAVLSPSCQATQRTRVCNIDHCLTCHMTAWGSWGPCSAPCGGGTKDSIRSIIYPIPDAAVCPATKVSSRCNTHACPSCLYGVWSKWGACSEPCGGGYHSRSKTIVNKVPNCPAKTQFRGCNIDPCPSPECQPGMEADTCCVFTSWGKWGSCSAQCGGGIHSRTRTVTKQGKNVVGSCAPLSQARSCNLDECPCQVNDPRPQCNGECTYSKWATWSKCSALCDGGIMSRTRTVTEGDQLLCPRSIDIRVCNIDPCSQPSSCTYAKWVKWNACSKPCGGGIHWRTRVVQTGDPKKCPDQKEQRACNVDPCPCVDPKVACDCQYGQWAKWTSCTQSCGGGSQGRTRPVFGAPSGGSGLCLGSAQERRCNIDPCPHSDTCKYGSWSLWTACSKNCGGGAQTRSHPLLSGSPSKCNVTTVSRPCNVESCQPSCTSKSNNSSECCEYSGSWSVWTTCSVPCGGGTQVSVLKRKSGACTDKTRKRICNVDPCDPDCPNPKDDSTCCKYTPWSAWNMCSVSCGGGVHTRTRRVVHGGVNCKHVAQTRQCNVDPCPCKVDDPRHDCQCNYTSKWSVWSFCSQPCNGGVMSRKRGPGTGGNGLECPRQVDERVCNLDPCPPSPSCVYGGWSNWGDCSTPCGGGLHERSRLLVSGSADTCTALKQSRQCNEFACPCANTTESCECPYQYWSSWAPCSKPCNDGTQYRVRALADGIKPHNCLPTKATRRCNVDPCPPPQKCSYSAWSAWGTCSESCGLGKKTRMQTLTAGSALVCNSTITQSQVCRIRQCCTYWPWGTWSPCSVSCGNGTSSRMRAIRTGSSTDCLDTTQAHNCSFACNGTCVYSSWTDWSPCQCTTGPFASGEAFHSHTRTLVKGSFSKCTEPIVMIEPCDVKGVGAWGSWSACSDVCNGSRNRTRMVEKGLACSAIQTESCNTCCGIQNCDDPCADYCANGGKCDIVNEVPKCECPEGFTGENCQNKSTVFDRDCEDWGCGYHGRCFTTFEGQPECVCEEGYYGLHCERQDSCYPNPCHNNGTCTVANGNPVCGCVGHWSGKFCDQSTLNLCKPDPCNGAGACFVKWGVALCDCNNGTYGDYCNGTGPLPPHVNKCNTNKLGACSTKAASSIDSSTPAGKCQFDRTLAKCASQNHCQDRVGIWCKSFFKPCNGSLPEECQDHHFGMCQDTMYSNCYSTLENSRDKYNSLCEFELAMIQCSIDSSCKSLQSLMCNHAAQTCGKEKRKIPSQTCPQNVTSMLSTSMLSLGTPEQDQPQTPVDYSTLYSTLHITAPERTLFYTKKQEAQEMENQRKLLTLTPLLITLIVLLVGTMLCVNRTYNNKKLKPYQHCFYHYETQKLIV